MSDEHFNDSLFIIMRQMKDKKFRKDLHEKLKKGEYIIKDGLYKKLEEEERILIEELRELEESINDSLKNK